MIVILTYLDLKPAAREKSIDQINLDDFCLIKTLDLIADIMVFVGENGQKKILKNRFGDLDTIPVYVD